MKRAFPSLWPALAATALAMLLGSAPAAAGTYDDAFPAPLTGWTAGAVEVNSVEEELMGMPLTRRRFLREYTLPDGAGLAIALDSFDCMAAAAIDALHGDAALQQQSAAQMRPMRIAGHAGIETFGASGRRDMVGLKLTDCGILSIGGPAPPDGAIDAYLKAIDFRRMQEVLR